jgi:hypothetical protein
VSFEKNEEGTHELRKIVDINPFNRNEYKLNPSDNIRCNLQNTSTEICFLASDIEAIDIDAIKIIVIIPLCQYSVQTMHTPCCRYQEIQLPLIIAQIHTKI